MAIGNSVEVKILIKYIAIIVDMKRRSQMILSLFRNKKTGPENDENFIDFRWSDVQEGDEEDIAEINFIESLQSKLIRKISQKVTRGFFDNYGTVLLKKLKRSFLKYFIMLEF